MYVSVSMRPGVDEDAHAWKYTELQCEKKRNLFDPAIRVPFRCCDMLERQRLTKEITQCIGEAMLVERGRRQKRHVISQLNVCGTSK